MVPNGIHMLVANDGRLYYEVVVILAHAAPPSCGVAGQTYQLPIEHIVNMREPRPKV
jgi:hypothetical protein